MNQKELSGFDYAVDRAWYKRHYARISKATTKLATISSSTECVSTIQLQGKQAGDWINEQWLQESFDKYPKEAVERILSIIGTIEIEDTLWFHRDSNTIAAEKTRNADAILAPTALIPAGFWPEKRDGRTYINIYICRLPANFASPEIESLMVRQAVIHELAHCLVGSAWTLTTSKLIRYGRVVDGEEAILRFIPLMRGICPISRYSASYWQSDEFYAEDPNELKGRTLPIHIEEEIVEAITAALVGYAFCKKGSTNAPFNPFKDRPWVFRWIEDFLNAKWLKE